MNIDIEWRLRQEMKSRVLSAVRAQYPNCKRWDCEIWRRFSDAKPRNFEAVITTIDEMGNWISEQEFSQYTVLVKRQIRFPFWESYEEKVLAACPKQAAFYLLQRANEEIINRLKLTGTNVYEALTMWALYEFHIKSVVTQPT